ncbi:hypothetical protein [Butyrivibrio sp. VCB2006]|uniref:hypothetical protein n=1 Tax=Butyrivibrio sp. VCB2006 TaxID=1280679 RepID=UPI0004182549|nr:hypothetical protein [Butyrivibrio sp. VCB2006]
MRRLIGATIAVSGIIFGAFIINIMLFCFVPSYHDALERAVGKDDDIPVVTVDKESGNVVVNKKEQVANRLETLELEPEEDTIVPLAAAAFESSFDIQEKTEEEATTQEVKELQIIDKEYHEDCGTGKGYWVIKYEDGSTGVEEY